MCNIWSFATYSLLNLVAVIYMEVAALHSDHYTHVQVRDFIEPCPQAFNQEKVGMGLRPWKRLHVDITIRDIKNILLEIFISNNTRGIKIKPYTRTKGSEMLMFK